MTADLGAVSLSGRGLFWSPDSQTIAFAAESALRTIPAAGGTPFVVGRIPGPGSRMLAGVWLPDGTIVFSAWRDSIYRVPSSGGTPELHVPLNPAKEVDAHFLTMAPGNRLVVGVHERGEDDALRLDVVENGRRTPLSSDTDMWSQRFVPPNNLLFIRRLTNPGLWSAPFENGALDLKRAALVQPGAVDFDAAGDGTLITRFAARNRRELVWVTRSGQATAIPGPAVEMTDISFELAPDGGRVLMSTVDRDFRAHLVVRDLATGRDTLVPPPRQVGAMTRGASASWAPGGRLLFGVGGVETSEIYDWPADGLAGGRKLVDGLKARMNPQHQEIYFTVDDRGTHRLRRAPVGADGIPGTSQPVFSEKAEPSAPWFDLSPDGRLLAFVDSNETDRLNIVVATLPDLRERRQVISNGFLPTFSSDGRSLWYVSGLPTAGATGRQLQVVPVTMTPLTIGAPSVVLVEDPSNGIAFTSFDVAKDGRLLATRRAAPEPGDEARVVLMQNWQAARPPR